MTFHWPRMTVPAPLLLCVALSVAGLHLAACSEPGAAASGEAVSHTEGALTGDALVLDHDGERIHVRLAGVRAPREGDAARQAREHLAELAREAGGALRLERLGEDRHGRVLGRVHGPDGDLSEALVSEGWLAVATHADTREAASLLPLEAQARAEGRGAWGSGAFAVRGADPDPLAAYLDSVQIVQGRVTSTGQSRQGRVFLNFGADWRTDFTVAVERRHVRLFEEAGIDLAALEGTVVRARGWMRAENGPLIALDHPEALEIVDAPEAAALP
ncbi:thermonuclease family protein [Glycocaulis profundi]|nr:thermonuclease family protein [Glycocaulis profundi]